MDPKALAKLQTDLRMRQDVIRKSAKINRSVRKMKYPRAGTLAEEVSMVPGGMEQFSGWVQASALRETKFVPLVENFFALPPSRQNAVELEEMCLTLGISPAELLGVCVEIAYEKKRNITKLIASVAMPKVMQANIRQAKKAEGVEDRRMFMQSTGILPTPKGSTINVSSSSQSATITQDGQPTGLPAFEDSTVSFSEVIRRATETPQAALPEPIVDAEVEE